MIIIIVRGIKKAVKDPYTLKSPKPSGDNKQVWLLLKVMLFG